MNSIIIADISQGDACPSNYKLYKYDYGRILRIMGGDLPEAVEIDFSLYDKGGDSIKRIGATVDGVTDVPIPDSMLENNDTADHYYLYAFVYLDDGVTGRTVRKITLTVTARPKPGGIEEDPEREETTFNQIMSAVGQITEGKGDTLDYKDNILRLLAGEKELSSVTIEGAGGTAREIELQKSETAIQWRYTGEEAWKDLVQLADITGPAGENGKDGANGQPGADGAPGQDGADGKDGITPHIGDNGNWYIGDTDTGVKAEAPSTDSTLTESGKAADAAETGRKIGELKSDLKTMGLKNGEIISSQKIFHNWDMVCESFGGARTLYCSMSSDNGGYLSIKYKDGTSGKLSATAKEFTVTKDIDYIMVVGGDVTINYIYSDLYNQPLVGSINEEKISQSLLNDIRNNVFVKRKPFVTFTADDGYKEDITILKPIFKKYNVPCCIAMESSIINNIDERIDLQNNHRWEFMCHGIDATLFTTLTEGQLNYQLSKSKKDLEDLGFVIKDVVYPSGAANATTKRVSKKYFRCGLMFNAASQYAVNKGIIDSFTIHRVPLGSFTADGLNTLEYYKTCVDRAKEENGWVIFCMHSASSDFDETQQQYLDDVIAYCIEQGVEIGNVTDGYEIFGNGIEYGTSYNGTCEQSDADTERFVVTKDGKTNLPIQKLVPLIHKSNNLITDYPLNKISIAEISNYNAGFPLGVGGTLLTSRFENWGYQLWFPNTKDEIYKRIWGGSVWKDWHKVSIEQGSDYTVSRLFTLSSNWSDNFPIVIGRRIYIRTFEIIGNVKATLSDRYYSYAAISQDKDNPTIIGATSDGMQIQMYYKTGYLLFRYSETTSNNPAFIDIAYV